MADPHASGLNPEVVMTTLAVAVFLGIVAQLIAHRLRLPAILPLLLLGMGAGPSGLAIFDPNTMGITLEAIVHLGVAIILFEGGLSLAPGRLREIGGPLRNLLTIGTAVTGVGSAALAHYVVGLSWPTAALFGAIVTVTGPTVIAPLLRHMIAPRRVRTLLISEGLMIDAVGAVLAYFVLQWIERQGMPPTELMNALIVLSLTGTILGFAAGMMAIWVIRQRRMSEELSNLVILALLLGAFIVAEHQAPQSGILASVVMGLTVTYQGQRLDMSPVKAFKGQLTVLTISVLFILLSARLDLNSIQDLGLSGLWVVIGMILIVRPVSVWLSAWNFDWREKTMLGLNAPRGIVAAAVVSLAALELRRIGLVEDAAALEGLVYLTILITCAWSTVMAPLLPRWLGYVDDPSRRRAILVGANPLSVALGRELRAHQWQAIFLDTAPTKLRQLREEGFHTVRGDARDAVSFEEADIERDTHVVALTTNDPLNMLVAELVRAEFDVEHPALVLQQPSPEFGQGRQAWADLISGRGLDYVRWTRRLDGGQARVLTVDLPQDEEHRIALATLLEEHRARIVVVCSWNQGRPDFTAAWGEVSTGEQVTLLIDDSIRPQLDAALGAGDGDEAHGTLSASDDAAVRDDDAPVGAGSPA